MTITLALAMRQSAILSKIIVVGTIGTLLSGCIPIPYVTSTPMPIVSEHIPDGLRSSGRELMILTQVVSSITTAFGGTSGATRLIKSPVFVQGKDLDSIVNSLKSESEIRLLLIGVVATLTTGPTPGPFIYLGEHERLELICLMAVDGESIRLRIRGGAVTDRHHSKLGAARQRAMAAVLREPTWDAFDSVDGPCGLFGAIDWSRSVSSRVSDFLARMPHREPGDQSISLAELTDRLTKTPSTSRDALLLIATSWRGNTVVEAPVFLTAEDFAGFQHHAPGSNPVDIFTLLAGGARAPENVRVDRLCMIRSDGLALWWSQDAETWQIPKESSPDAEWKEGILAVLRGKSDEAWKHECAPLTMTTWSEQDKRNVVEFMERLPTKESLTPAHSR